MTNNKDSFFYAQGPLATDLLEVGHDPTGLDQPGFWAAGGNCEDPWTLEALTCRAHSALAKCCDFA